MTAGKTRDVEPVARCSCACSPAPGGRSLADELLECTAEGGLGLIADFAPRPRRRGHLRSTAVTRAASARAPGTASAAVPTSSVNRSASTERDSADHVCEPFDRPRFPRVAVQRPQCLARQPDRAAPRASLSARARASRDTRGSSRRTSAPTVAPERSRSRHGRSAIPAPRCSAAFPAIRWPACGARRPER